MTYYSDIKFFNGLPISSLFYYTTLLCLHQCLLHTPCAFYSFAFYALCAMSLQCTIPLLYVSVVALYLLLPTSITLNCNHDLLLFSAFSSSLYTPCPCNLLKLLHLLTLMSSTLPDHHCNSSASLVVPPTHPSSLGVMLRCLSLSGS
jgi:hypothetical protein